MTKSQYNPTFGTRTVPDALSKFSSLAHPCQHSAMHQEYGKTFVHVTPKKLEVRSPGKKHQ